MCRTADRSAVELILETAARAACAADLRTFAGHRRNCAFSFGIGAAAPREDETVAAWLARLPRCDCGFDAVLNDYEAARRSLTDR